MKSADTGASGPASMQAPCPLYKPLWELTEDDIAQVTREDCRRFLKEKGMRRPSWNKSQAIQQVISLKALLEPKPEADEDEEEEERQHQHQRQHQGDEADEEEGEEEEEEEEEEQEVGGGRELERHASSSSSSLPKQLAESPSSPAGSRPASATSPASTRDATNGAQFAPTYHTNYTEAPYRRRDSMAAAAATPRPPLFIPGDTPTSFRVPMAAGREALPAVRPEVAGVSPRVTADPTDPATVDATQMTIFYGGRVNVYDAVPTDKAVSIMRVAASGDCPWEFPSSHHQRQQIQQSQLLLHYNNSQQPFRLLRPPATYGADNPAAAPAPSFPQPHPNPVQQSAPFAGCSDGERGRKRERQSSLPGPGPRQPGLDQHEGCG